jgi:hypothetical protein
MYHGSTRALSLVFLALGVLLLVRTIAAGGGPASVGVLLSLAFIAVGVARLWLSGVFRGRTRGRHLP